MKQKGKQLSLTSDHWIQERTRHMSIEIQVLVLDKHETLELIKPDNWIKHCSS